MVAAALALPSSALASTLRLEPGGGEDAPHLEYRASPGEANRASIAVSGAKAEIDDPGATIEAQQGCTSVTPSHAVCDLQSSTSEIRFVDVELGDADDTLDMAGARAVANGGAGNDTLNGGADPDTLNGGGGTDTMRGAGGADYLSDGDATGGANADALDGGADGDTVDYFTRTAMVTVDLVDPAPDGETGEGDVLTSIEGIRGGRAGNVLRGDDGPNPLAGGDGDDVLDGRGGPDDLFAGRGNDLLIGGPGVDQFSDGPGDDTLRLDNPPRVRDRYLACESGDDLIVGPGPSPSISLGCERADFGFGFVMSLIPRKVTRKVLKLAVPCPDAFRSADGACRGALVVEPVGAYARSKKTRRRQRFARKEFSFTGATHNVTARLNAAGRRELRKRFFRMQFTVVLKETASGATRRFTWTGAIAPRFLRSIRR